MSIRFLSLVVVLAVACGICTASAVAPTSGPSGDFSYKYKGTPAFHRGLFSSVNASAPLFVLTIPGHGAAAVSISPDGDVAKSFTYFDSFECVDEHSFLYTSTIVAVPTGEVRKECGIMYMNETQRIIIANPNGGPSDGTCPTVEDANTYVNDQSKYTSVLEYAPGPVGQPNVTVCENKEVLPAPLPPSPTRVPTPDSVPVEHLESNVNLDLVAPKLSTWLSDTMFSVRRNNTWTNLAVYNERLTIGKYNWTSFKCTSPTTFLGTADGAAYFLSNASDIRQSTRCILGTLNGDTLEYIWKFSGPCTEESFASLDLSSVPKTVADKADYTLFPAKAYGDRELSPCAEFDSKSSTSSADGNNSKISVTAVMLAALLSFALLF